MVWNAVAAIGGSLISGIFGSKKKKEETITDQTSTSSIDYKALADAAIQGGYNPLTAIRTGGASGFVTTRTTGKNVTTSSGGGGVGAAIGDAIASAGASGLFGSFNTPKNDPIRVKSKTTGAVSSLVRSQLPGSSRAPALNVQPTQRIQASPRTAKPPTAGRALAPYLEDGKLTNTDVGKQTKWWESDPNRVDGAQYEDAYGEMVGGVLGVIPALQDSWHNLKRGYISADEWMRKQTLAANYRVAARRPFNPRPEPPKGYRYAN